MGKMDSNIYIRKKKYRLIIGLNNSDDDQIKIVFIFYVLRN